MTEPIRHHLIVSSDPALRRAVATLLVVDDTWTDDVMKIEIDVARDYAAALGPVKRDYDIAVIDLVLPKAQGLRGREDIQFYGLDLALALRLRGVPVVVCLPAWSGEENQGDMSDWVVRLGERFGMVLCVRPFDGLLERAIANARTLAAP